VSDNSLQEAVCLGRAASRGGHLDRSERVTQPLLAAAMYPVAGVTNKGSKRLLGKYVGDGIKEALGC
jgi:hypothetical protein